MPLMAIKLIIHQTQSATNPGFDYGLISPHYPAQKLQPVQAVFGGLEMIHTEEWFSHYLRI